MHLDLRCVKIPASRVESECHFKECQSFLPPARAAKSLDGSGRILGRTVSLSTRAVVMSPSCRKLLRYRPVLMPISLSVAAPPIYARSDGVQRLCDLWSTNHGFSAAVVRTLLFACATQASKLLLQPKPGPKSLRIADSSLKPSQGKPISKSEVRRRTSHQETSWNSVAHLALDCRHGPKWPGPAVWALMCPPP